MSIYRFISRFDVFGKDMKFRFKSNEKHTSCLGGIGTAFIFAAISYQVFSVVLELIQQTKPEVISTSEYVGTAEKFVFTDEIFTFAMGMEDSSFHHFIDESVYKIKARQIISTRDQNNQMNYSYKTFYLTQCTEQSFNIPEVNNYFLSQPYENLYCLKNNGTTDTLEIGGDYDLDYFAYIQFQVYKCSGAHCINATDINNYNKYYKNPQFAIYFNDVLTDPKNRNTPITKIGRDYYSLSSSGMKKDISLYFIKNIVSTTEGTFYSYTTDDHQFGFSQYQELSLLDNNSDLMFTVSLRLEKKKQNRWTRKYLTLSQGLSQIGGIYQALMALGYFFFVRFNSFELNRKLMNQIYSFESTTTPSQISQEKVNQPENTRNLNSQKIGNEIKTFMNKRGSMLQSQGMHGKLLFQLQSQHPQSAKIRSKKNSQFGINDNTLPENNKLDMISPQEKLPKKKLLLPNQHSGKLISTIPLDEITSPASQSLIFPDNFNQKQPFKYLQQQQKYQPTNLQGTFPTNYQNGSPQSFEKSDVSIQKIFGQMPKQQVSHQQDGATPILFYQKPQIKPYQENLSITSINLIPQKNFLQTDQKLQSQQQQLSQQKPNQDDQSKEQQDLSEIELVKPNGHFEPSEIVSPSKKRKQIDHQLKEINRKFVSVFAVTANRIKMRVIDYLRYFFPSQQLRIKKQQMNLGLSKLFQNLNIINVLKKLAEIEKLKRLLLDDHQIRLFEYFPRPIVPNCNIESQIACDFILADRRTEIEKACDAFEAYSEMMQEGYVKTALDNKIISMLDPNFFSLLSNQFPNLPTPQISKMNDCNNLVESNKQTFTAIVKESEEKMNVQTDESGQRMKHLDRSIELQKISPVISSYPQRDIFKEEHSNSISVKNLINSNKPEDSNNIICVESGSENYSNNNKQGNFSKRKQIIENRSEDYSNDGNGSENENEVCGNECEHNDGQRNEYFNEKNYDRFASK